MLVMKEASFVLGAVSLEERPNARPWTHFLRHPPPAQCTRSKMSNILPFHYSGRPTSHAPPASTSQTSSTSTIRPHAQAPPQFTVARGQGATMSGNQSQGPGLRYPSNKKSIYDRNLNRSKNSELSRAAFAYLFIEMIAYAQKGAKDVGGLEQKYVMNLSFGSLHYTAQDLLRRAGNIWLTSDIQIKPTRLPHRRPVTRSSPLTLSQPTRKHTSHANLNTRPIHRTKCLPTSLWPSSRRLGTVRVRPKSIHDIRQ